ncbi:MAG: lysylphosphatidylglycerol synthase transmembrane domain-containing protein [Methanomicrobiaceae archaeon]|nr:lysylphosphatidylglycerol synthase transmembrane domain-containing protein [Methanomicrobiaceae archaeon]
MWKKVSAVVIPTIIAAAILAFMLARVWGDLLVALENARFVFLAAAVAFCTAAWVIRGWRYRYILQGLEVTVGTWFSTACIFVSQTANLIVPARLGDLVRMVILRHEKQTTYSRGLSSLVVERIFDITMVAVLGLLALPALLNVPDWFVTIIVVPLVGGAVLVGFLLYSGNLSSRNRYFAMLIDLFDEIRQASLHPRAFLVLGVSSIVIWLVDVAVCYVVALMFSETIPFMVVVLAIVIGNLVKAVPITPGGVGTYEISVALTFELAGVSPVSATLIAVTDHLIKNLVTLAGGVASIYLFGGWALALFEGVLRRSITREDFDEP